MQFCHLIFQTSLLNTILGDMNILEGTVTVSGSFAYVPQTAWVYPATVRDNILFGKDYESIKYSEALAGAALWEVYKETVVFF